MRTEARPRLRDEGGDEQTGADPEADTDDDIDVA